MSTRTPSRRGIALLLALVALVALTTLGAATLRTGLASSRGAMAIADRSEHVALVDSLFPSIVAWLEDPSNPADTLDDWDRVIEARQDGLHVEARAIDLSGRLRLDLLSSAVSDSLPSSLEHLEPVEMSDVLRVDPVLPEHLLTNTTAYHAPGTASSPDSWLTSFGSGDLNVATAPVPLLMTLLSGLDAGATRELLASRSAGAPLNTQAIQTLQRQLRAHSRQAGQPAVQLTTRSDAIGVLIETSRGARARSTWIVLERSDPRGLGLTIPAGQSWHVVHRREVSP